MHSISLLPLAVSLAGTAVAQFPPAPEGTTVIPSTLWPGASVSYKEVSCANKLGATSCSRLITPVDKIMRDDTKCSLVCRICESAFDSPRTAGNGAEQHQHLLLVLRVSKGSLELTTRNLVGRWTRRICS